MAIAPLSPRRRRLLCLLAVLLLGLLLFVWHLGRSGLVDETPPLFAASARAMADTGDWLVPRVNGLPRYDKPPLVYWLIGGLHALPGRPLWDPLGGWASNLPSALSTVALMLLLADTLLRFPQACQTLAASPDPQRSGASSGSADWRDAEVTASLPRSIGAPGSSAGASGSIQAAALAAPLAFALSPLVLLWGRIGVSDALFTATLSAALLLFWRSYAAPGRLWWQPWLMLALAVLSKGPVAVVLSALILAAFAALQADGSSLRRRLRPLPGLVVLTAAALPWYALTLWREGRPFWDSFFGYHNLQRFSSVVNHHLQPWWYFGPVLLVASLPATPLLLLGLWRALAPAPRAAGAEGSGPRPAALSLAPFAACWLLVVLAFFTAAATKLPSYWLPATPAAGLLIALAGMPLRPIGFRPRGAGDAAADDDVMGAPAQDGIPAATEAGPAASAGASPAAVAASVRDPWLQRAWRLTLLLTLLLAAVFLAGPLWVPLIQDPEMPTLPAGILASRRLPLAGACWLLAAAVGWWQRRRPWPQPLLLQQLPLVAFVPLALLPLWGLGDQLRGAPVRAMAAAVRSQIRPGEPLAMVGILKPSLHYYSRLGVRYEGIPPEGPLNLADRLRRESRPGQPATTPEQQPTLLVVIDQTTAALPQWRGLDPVELGRSGLYRLWRLDRRRLEQRAGELRAAGLQTDWWKPRPERY